MARPRKSDRQEMAAERIENAFRTLLEAEPYSEITVEMLTNIIEYF